MQPLNKVVIVGVGLIGGSFAKGIKTLGLAKKVTGFGRHPDKLAKGVSLGVLDDYETDPIKAFNQADLVMLAVPLGAMKGVMQMILPFLPENCIVTDGGSAKVCVINAAESVFLGSSVRFVAGHPIAGKEKSGVEAADANLYQDHRVILTPTSTTDSEALETVRYLWQALGAEVTEMEPSYHDEVLAATSHLPHILAFNLVDLLNEHSELGDVFQYTAGGFRDFTRIASSEATMWRDIALNNKSALLKWLGHYQTNLAHLMHLIETDQAKDLHSVFTDAKNARDQHIVNKTSSNP